MYDELKERCRACSQGCIYPSECSYFDKPPLRCMRQLLSEAADAIEELSRDLDSMNEANIALYGALPKWIPVTERLPEKTGTYLAWMKWDLTEADEEPSAYPIEYDAEEEAFGWWKSYYDAETLGWAGEDFVRYEGITHWMPLPEPPKEE